MSSQLWYYRTLGQELGPVPEATLRRLISSGILNRNDMASNDHVLWMMVCELPFIEEMATTSPASSTLDGISNQAVRTTSSRDVRNAIAESQSYLRQRDVKLAKQSRDRHHRQISIGLPDWERVVAVPVAVVTALFAIAGHMLYWLMAVAGPVMKSKVTWIVLGVVVVSYIVYVIPAQILTQTQTRAFLTDAVTELRRLRTENADEQQWDLFSRRVHAELREILPKVERAATSDDPVSMELLFLSRDFLPQMLADARDHVSEAEHKFDVHMDRVERVYVEDQARKNWIPSVPVVLVVLIDSFLFLGGAWWWRSKSR